MADLLPVPSALTLGDFCVRESTGVTLVASWLPVVPVSWSSKGVSDVRVIEFL